jgi:hypothetical protein
MGLTSARVTINLYSPHSGTLLRPCSAPASQRLFISSYPAPSGNEGYTPIMSNDNAMLLAAADAPAGDRSDASGSEAGADSPRETRARSAARLAAAAGRARSADPAAEASRQLRSLAAPVGAGREG